MSDHLQLTVKDELWLRSMDDAFDEKTDKAQTLTETNTLLRAASQRWCQEAQAQALIAQRAYRALGFVTVIAAFLATGCLILGICRWLHV